MRHEAEVAVVGAGIIGLATAFRLAGEGRDVLSIDAAAQPLSASCGNAGSIAAFNCVPVASPAVLRSLPRLLTHRDSPFAMRQEALPTLAPWLIRFLRQSLPRQARANATALAILLGDSLGAWQELADAARAGDLFRSNGCLYVFPSQDAFAAAAWDRAQRAAAAVRQFVVTPAEMAAMEPDLINLRGPGVFFPDAAHVVDPSALLDRLRAAAAALGVRSLAARVEDLQLDTRRVRLRGSGFNVDADQVVIAAGAWSRPLARQAGDRIPLDTERAITWNTA